MPNFMTVLKLWRLSKGQGIWRTKSIVIVADLDLLPLTITEPENKTLVWQESLGGDEEESNADDFVFKTLTLFEWSSIEAEIL